MCKKTYNISVVQVNNAMYNAYLKDCKITDLFKAYT